MIQGIGDITSGKGKDKVVGTKQAQVASGMDMRLVLFVCLMVAICGLFLIFPNLGSAPVPEV